MARRKSKPYEVVRWMRVKERGAPVQRARKAADLTQRQLAFLVKRSQTTIYLIETGQLNTITDDLGYAIAKRVNVPWEFLFEAQEAVRVAPMTNGDITKVPA